MTLQLCWFRNDLRVADNTALLQALQKGPTVAIYIATPGQWLLHDDAPIKRDFWKRNLQQLKGQLEKLDIPLCFFQVADYQEIPSLLQRVMTGWKIGALHCNTEYPLNERLRDAAVERLCQNKGINFFAYEDQCLLPPDLTLTADDRPFKVFTPFASKARAMLEIFGTKSASGRPTKRNGPSFSTTLKALPGQIQLEEIDWPAAELHWQTLWPAGEKEAHKRLQHFLTSKVQGYKVNRDIPAVDGTSTLSAYLNSGVISIRSCWNLTQDAGHHQSVQSWRNELLWRDFYKYVMYHYPHVCKNQAWNERYSGIPWRRDESDFQAWANGTTGFPLVDAAMRQLKQTGWMHNRLRMVVAMFLSKNLLIDWRWGERWFMQQLIDGDFSANNGGWQWSASTGTDAAPYFRIFNPIRQSERFDPQGIFIKTYIPELQNETAKTIHDPARLLGDYVKPCVDLRFSRERALAAFGATRA